MPLKIGQKLHLVQNGAARIPVLLKFSVCFQTQFKVQALAFKALCNLEPD